MALNLFVSNSLQELALTLNGQFKSRSLPVFQSQFVVTQTVGMNNWLKLQIASDPDLEIAANICFLKPNDLLHKVYRALGGAYNSTYSPDNVCWLLYKILGETRFMNRFPAISGYYRENEEPDGIRQMSLAQKLADLFDQYQIYRPGLIREWNNSSSDDRGIDWQQYAWLRAKQLAGEKFLDKTKLGADILSLLKDGRKVEDLRKHLPVVHLFGISILTAYHIDILRALSEHIDIHFYFLNPAPLQYWYDTVNEKQAVALISKGVAEPSALSVGNTLLGSWGKVIRDTFGLLFEHDEFLNTFTEVGVEEPSAVSLLHTIQYEIFHNLSNDQRSAIADGQLSDGSVIIHSCYTIAREVEALYNYLVHLADRKTEKLSPRDILVMVSDVNAYAPYIKAVFDKAPYRFQYTIADESVANGDSLVQALKSILELTEDGFGAETIVQLLDSASIRRHFGLTNISFIRTIVDQANIRFGIEGKNENDTVYVSWKYGLRRIMYGLCMSGVEEYELDGDTIFPLDVMEGDGMKEVIQFCSFVEKLIEVIDARKGARPVVKWVEYVEWVLELLLHEAGGRADDDYQALYKLLQSYGTTSDIVSEKVTYEVFCHHFLQNLTASIRDGNYAGGGITFCSLIPMRSIPFRVIALLGLNFDKFPRKETAISFNLMQQNWQRGDRNVKENDKHLFLETLLAAKEYLYISYLGQSVKDNSLLPPSALVDELIDYVEAKYEGDADLRKLMIVRQPLHSFSRRYTLDGDRLYTYLVEKGSDSIHLLDPDKQLEFNSPSEINLSSLVAFFKNPFKAYYNNVLAIRYDDKSDLLSETELFTLDKLQEWSLKEPLLTLSDEERDDFRRRLVKQGRLPLKNMSEIWLKKVEAEIKAVKMLFAEQTAGSEPEALPVDLKVSGISLTGVLRNVYSGRLVCVSFSKNDSKYQLEACIQYLAGRAMGSIEELSFISSKKGEAFTAVRLTQEEAMSRLEAMIQLYLKGHSSIVAFYPDLEEPGKTAELDLEKLRDKIDAKVNNYSYSFSDQYVLNEYNNGFFESEKVLDEFKKNCALLLTPLTQLFPGYY